MSAASPRHTSPVLIVEDEVELRDSLREVLEDEGYVVEVAADGREAMVQLARFRPCVVILDLMMPVMTGNEVYEAMQGDPNLAGIPVIISTSDPSRSPRGVPTIRKPLDLVKLIDFISHLC